MESIPEVIVIVTPKGIKPDLNYIYNDLMSQNKMPVSFITNQQELDMLSRPIPPHLDFHGAIVVTKYLKQLEA